MLIKIIERRIHIFLIVLSVIGLTSCKAKFKLFKTDTEEIKINSLITNIENYYVDYNSISVKFQVKFENENKRQILHGIYRIKKDSLIWLSMGPSLGIEIIRGVMDKDSLKFINRYNKTYYIGSYDYLKKISNADFNYKSIENILSNKIIFENNTSIFWKDYLTKNYSYDISDRKYKLEKKEKVEIEDYTDSFIKALSEIVVLPDIYKIEEYNWNDENSGRNLSIKYGDFKKVKDRYFPDNINVNIAEENDTVNFNLKLKQKSFDKKLKYPFKIPNKKYQRVY